MIFVEFVSSEDEKLHFVGKNLSAILADTDGGTQFGGLPLVSHREVAEEEIRALGCGFVEDGIAWVRKGCESYMLGTPR